MCCKKQKYSDSFFEYGFTYINTAREEKPQCVICYQVLSNCSIKPSKLKLHLQTHHSTHKKTQKLPQNYQTWLSWKCTWKQCEDSWCFLCSISCCSQRKKTSHYWRNAVKTACKKMVEIVLGKDVKKIATISLSNNTVQSRTSDMSTDSKEQVVKRFVQRCLVYSQFSWMNQQMLNTSWKAKRIIYFLYSSEEYE